MTKMHTTKRAKRAKQASKQNKHIHTYSTFRVTDKVTDSLLLCPFQLFCYPPLQLRSDLNWHDNGHNDKPQ
jgi:hypothetical protein